MRFGLKPERLVILFLITLMVTNVVLLFTEKIPPIAYCAALCLPAGFWLLWLILLKRPGIMYLLLLPILFIHCAQMVLVSMWGGSVIAADMFRNIFTTNAGEATELLSNLWPVIIFLAILFVPAIALAITSLFRKERLQKSFRIRALKAALLLLAIGGASYWAARACGEEFTLKDNIYPANALYNLKLAVRFSGQIREHKELSKSFRYNAQRAVSPAAEEQSQSREIYVMVVGETSRALNFGIYGYGRETTPHLRDCSGVVVYRDALTQSNATHKIVPLILTPAEASNYNTIYGCKSIITAFREAGFRTLYITNHAYPQTLMEHFEPEAERFISLREEFGHRSLDLQMLPILEEEAGKEPHRDLFILIHIYGSHYKYKQRYSEDFAKFLPDVVETISPKNKEAMVNSFDNSILALDSLLYGIMEIAGRDGSPAAMLYLSDHGEDLMDDSRERMLHSSPIPTIYQARIPFIEWFSQSYRERYPQKYANARANAEKPLSSNAAFHTVLDMASISTPYLKRELSTVSDTFQVVPREYLTDHNEPIKIKDIPWDKRDREVIERLGIAL